MHKEKMIKKENEDSFKLITLGESGVGKTSIIRRYIHNVFDLNNISTIGVNFFFKVIKLKNGKKIQIKLVDTGGQEKYRAVTKSYFKNCDGVLFIFSLNDIESFNRIKEWISLFNENHNGKEGIPMYLIGNMCDLEKKVNQDSIDAFLNDYKNFKYKETSAKDNTGIEKSFEEISEDLYKIFIEEGSRNKTQKIIKINRERVSTKKKQKKKNCLMCNQSSDA